MNTNNLHGSHGAEFAQKAEAKAGGVLSELGYFLGHNKKWWLTPIVFLLLILGIFLVLAGTAAAPLIYTLF